MRTSNGWFDSTSCSFSCSSYPGPILGFGMYLEENREVTNIDSGKVAEGRGFRELVIVTHYNV